MIRRISVKWLLAVLAAVVIPFTLFAFFANQKITERLGQDVVRFHLLSTAAELSDRIDEEVAERRQDVELIAAIPVLNWFVDGLDDDRGTFRRSVESIFDQLVLSRGVYDYVLAIDDMGHVIGMNTVRQDGTDLEQWARSWFFRGEFGSEPWFEEALLRGASSIDVHSLMIDGPEDLASTESYVGFVQRVNALPNQETTTGVVLTLMNWRHLQSAVASFGVRRLSDDALRPSSEDMYASSYAWIWKSDADTIIAHPNEALYGQRVSELEGGALVKMVDTALDNGWGMFPDYEFRGIAKKAAFKHCNEHTAGGFGWVVGIGVDNVDIYAPVHELSNWLVSLAVSILILAVLFTVYVARRTTRPLLDVERQIARVAGGDLDARVEVRSMDELGHLAQSFNNMTAELKESRERLVQAEKEAAWREMARQIAHEIKNPLTPISLTMSLLKRSRDEQSPEFDQILERTIDVVQRQVENMREVVRDFAAFAGVPTAPSSFDVAEVLKEVLALQQAAAKDCGVLLEPISVEGEGNPVMRANREEFQRAFLNLVSNALEAMPDGGTLTSVVRLAGTSIEVVLRDSGTGISPDALGHLFEPHFTTRTSGTGLGLAIVRRVVEDAGGTVSIQNADSGPGAIVRMSLPRIAEVGLGDGG